jgi:hypothetical protein
LFAHLVKNMKRNGENRNEKGREEEARRGA